MKKLIGIVLTLCILSALVVPVYATGNDYPYIDTNPSIITPDSFEEMFSDEEIDRVSYDYEMIIPEEREKALIALQMEIKVGNNAYLSSAVGNVRSHVLPSGDVLWHGPIRGSITIGGEEFKVTAGFSKLESSGEVMISITMQSGSEIIAFSFGNNIIRGEVLEFFAEKASASQQYGQQPGLSVDQDLSASAINSQNNESSLLSFPDLTVNPGIFDGDGGGGGSENLNLSSTAAYVSTRYAEYESTEFIAMKTVVYWDGSKNQIILSLFPSTTGTRYYANTLGLTIYDITLNSFSVSLSLADSSAENYGIIKAADIPDLSPYILEGERIAESVPFRVIFLDILSSFGLFSSITEEILNGLQGDLIYDNNNDALHHGFTINVSEVSNSNTENLDELEKGLLFGFILDNTNDDVYIGDTQYNFSVKIEYFIEYWAYNNSGIPCLYYTFAEGTTSHSGTVDIQ